MAEDVVVQTTSSIRLAPDGLPLRRTANARQFRSEIVRLYLEGHTLGAIRKSLAEVDVHVSESTVRREFTRRSVRPLQIGAAKPEPAADEASPKSSPLKPMVAGQRRTGKEIAEEFVKGRIANPLLRIGAQR